MNQKNGTGVLTETRIINESELKSLLRAIEPHMEQALRTRKRIHFIADYFLVFVGSLTGMRVSEIISVKLGDINNNSIMVTGKGQKTRRIPLGRKSKAAIEDLIKIKRELLGHPMNPSDFLFLNQRGRKFSRHAVAARMRYWLRKVGIDREVNFHGLRHGFATYLLNRGFLIHEAAKILGHASISTTSVYLHFSRETQDRIDAAL
jgi:integrase/recombinase XerC